MAGRKASLVLAGAMGVLGCRAAPEESGPVVGTGRRTEPAAARATPSGTVLAPTAERVLPSIRVRVDPRVELLCILARLAGYDEYDHPHDFAYAHDAAERFAPFADHAAVRTLKRVRFLWGVSHDAVVNLAVHLGELPELAEHGAWDGGRRSLDRRWPLYEARRFREEARRFAVESDFQGFLEQNAALYAETEHRFRELLGRRDVVAWLDSFFVVPAGTAFEASPGLLNGASGYGSTVHEADGQRIHQVIGVSETDALGLPLFTEGALGTVAHEYCHAFANPLVERFAAELEVPCQRLYPYVAQVMERQAYGTWRTMMSETLVRACCTRFWPAGPEREAAIRSEIERGFPWTRELGDALALYEADRSRHPTLDSFVPQIVAVMEAWPERLAEQAVAAEEHRRFWQARASAPSRGLEDEVERGLAEALTRIEGALAADGPGSDPRERVRAALRAMRFERDAQVTVLDARGDFVFHVMDLQGSAYAHLDVQGEPVYRRLNEAAERRGLTRNFDFVTADGAQARANAIAWQRLAEPAWLVCVEGHEWQKR